MNSLWLAVALAIVGLCHSQLVCAGIDTINKFLDAKVEPLYDDNLQNSISALRELREKNKSKPVLNRMANINTNCLINDLLVAASWIEHKNCGDNVINRKFSTAFIPAGAANRLLLNIIDKRDVVCARDLLEREQQRYSSLDSTQTAKVEKLEQLTLKERGVLNSNKDHEGSDLVWQVANKYSFTKALLNPNFCDSLLAYLETESNKNRCQFLGEELKALFVKHIISPCRYFIRPMEPLYEEHQSRFVRKVEFFEHNTIDRESLKLIDYQEFNHHLIGYKLCRFINEKSTSSINHLSEELKDQCLKRLHQN